MFIQIDTAETESSAQFASVSQPTGRPPSE